MTNTQDHILVVIADNQINFLLDRVLRSAGYSVGMVQEGATALKQAGMLSPSLVILGERLADGQGIDFAAEFARRFPAVPVILFFYQDNLELLKRAMRLGVNDFLAPPLRSEEILRSVKNAIDLSQRRKESLLLESRRFTSSLQRQLDELETLIRLGREVTGKLDTDQVLSAVIEAAVELTGAEEGSLLLQDEKTGELYMRAARNFQEDFVRTFRLPITDSLAGSVMRSGQTILLDENTPQKIKTAYLVQSLAYVPLEVNGRVFGVMGVDNRESRLPLTQKHVKLLKALASYAVIALENARVYSEMAADRNKLEAILTGVQDGVIVMDQERRLVLVNHAVREYFKLGANTRLTGKPFQDVFPQEELQLLVSGGGQSAVNVTEICPDENLVLMARATPIADVGMIITMHDITNLKKLDRIKTNFVHTVSHDLRSPLTAILGYVELMERVGPLTDTQKDFLRRVQVSVHNITRLIDNLLELGKIESGLDVHREYVRMDQIVTFSVDVFKKQAEAKEQQIKVDFEPDFPSLLANPVQMRQMIDHLLDNAIKYTHAGGKIRVTGLVKQNQAIVQVMDTGVGIPAVDLPYIFDKFYRASNASAEASGTGLGLAIVKSIVEAHNGRVWVESIVGEGTTITIVLPL